MTKAVRIENADTAAYKVVVEVYEKSHIEGIPDTLVTSSGLDFPTAMLNTCITSTRYLVVREA